MSEQVKFTEDELKVVEKIQKTYIELQNEFGNTAITKLKLLQQVEGITKYEDELNEKFTEAQNEEQEFLKNITEKYGDGQLDPKTGIFTPSK